MKLFIVNCSKRYVEEKTNNRNWKVNNTILFTLDNKLKMSHFGVGGINNKSNSVKFKLKLPVCTELDKMYNCITECQFKTKKHKSKSPTKKSENCNCPPPF